MKEFKPPGTLILRKMKKSNFHQGAMAMTGFKGGGGGGGGGRWAGGSA